MTQQQPVPLITIQAPAAPAAQTGPYNETVGRRTGGIQIACGVVSIIIGIVGMFYSNLFYGAEPIWGGAVST